MSGRFLTNIVCDVGAAVGGCWLVYTVIHYRQRQRHCTTAVDGTVTRHLTMGDGIFRTYSAVYQFTLNGKRYEAGDFKYVRHPRPSVGTTIKLLVDPEDPIVLQEPKRARRALYFGISWSSLVMVGCFALQAVFVLTGVGIFEH